MLLPVTLLPGNTSDGIRYSSSNAEIVAVSNSGKISGLQLGNAVITLGNDSGLSISLDVMVDNYAAVNGYEVIAHRGASGYQRENSIAAFEYATEMGADMIELDIRRTSDGKAICHHDASLKINNKSYSIANYTLSKLKKLDSGLCSLEEALAAIEKTNCTIQIDIKSKNLEKEAVNLVKKHNLTDRVCYGCFNKDVLDAIKLADPNAKVVCITNDSTVINHLMNGTGSYNVEVASVRYDLLNPEVIYDLHRAGLEVYVWEIDDISVIQEYINWGVDGVITNYPDRAMQRQE